MFLCSVTCLSISYWALDATLAHKSAAVMTEELTKLRTIDLFLILLSLFHAYYKFPASKKLIGPRKPGTNRAGRREQNRMSWLHDEALWS
jgi:hypothetical protein